MSDALVRLEEALASWIEKDSSPLLDAARYSLLAPAKRLRPLLLLTTARLYGAPLELALTPACALEMIHTYSLIHDDLPCMDDDDLRRGKPTLHKVFPEWHALLTGDYLLTYAFELLSQAPGLSAAQQIALVRLFAQGAGGNGMIGGQMIDLLSENQTIPWPRLKEMHSKKTARLISIALEAGAQIGGAPPEDLTRLRQIGECIGVAFQLVDDLLDCTATTQQLGKSAGSDLKAHKSTAISILGLEKTRATIDALYEEAQALCRQLSCPSELLQTLLHQLVARHN